MESGKTLGVGVAPSSSEGSELAVKGSDGATNIALIPGSDTESSLIGFYNAAYNSTQGYIKYDNSDNSLQFRVNLQPRLHIKNDGNVGIGETNPAQLLSLKSADPRILLTETTNNSNCYLDYAAGGILEISVDDNNVDTSSKFQVRIDGATAGLTLDSTGLGVGTTSPSEDLEIKGDQTATVYINAGQHDASTANVAQLKLGFNQSDTNDSIGYIKLTENAGNSFDGDLTFGVPYNDSGPKTREALRIKHSGDVSISGDGTVHGVSKLTILPADRTTAFSASDGDTWHDIVLKQTGDAANNAVGLAFEISTSGYHKNAGTGIAAVKNGTAGDYGTDLVFITRGQSTAATEKLRIMSDGMVGVGVDNPAVAGGYHGMEIGGSANTGLRLSATHSGGWAFTDYEINGSQAYIAGVKGGTDSLSSAASWRIATGASLDSNVKFVVNSDGSVLPGSDNTQDLGSTSYRWANLYTGDLNLCNEGSYNEVDGTSGSWTMQEGDSDLFLINRKSGKKYKFNLTEVA